MYKIKSCKANKFLFPVFWGKKCYSLSSFLLATVLSALTEVDIDSLSHKTI